MWGAIASLAGSAMKDTLISPKDLWLNYENRKAVSAANEYNYQMWLAQNAYNTPVNQMLRLKEAGLNPNLVAGQLASSAAGHASPANVRRYQADTMDLIGNYQDIRQKDAQTQLIRAQRDSSQANADSTRRLLPVEEDLKNQQFDLVRRQNRSVELQNEMTEERMRLLRKQLPVMEEQLEHKSGNWYQYWRNFGEMVHAFSPFANSVGNYLDMGLGK